MKLRGTWVVVILTAVGVGLIVLALTLGGSSDDSSDSGATAAGTTGPVAAPTDDSTPGRNSGESADATKTGSAAAGSGGAKSGGGSKAAGDETQSPAQEVKKKSSPKPDAPPKSLADLSPAERKKLHGDLYKQGLAVCGSFGPEELAKGFNFPTNDPAQLARLYAEAYEARSPSLVLPVQQGCLAGLKQWIAKHE